jgi:hypothetical protein
MKTLTTSEIAIRIVMGAGTLAVILNLLLVR